VPCALKISEAASLAMHSSGLLAAQPGKSLSTKEIASVFGVSEAHLSKVLQRLVKAGFLDSVRGPKGGFSMAKEPHEITLLEVYEVTEGPIEPSDCLFGLPLCNGADCVLGRVLTDANEKLWKYLSETTLADINPVFKHERFQVPRSI
jgi:Rrf2 family protein